MKNIRVPETPAETLSETVTETPAETNKKKFKERQRRGIIYYPSPKMFLTKLGRILRSTGNQKKLQSQKRSSKVFASKLRKRGSALSWPCERRNSEIGRGSKQTGI